MKMKNMLFGTLSKETEAKESVIDVAELQIMRSK
jgi:hypothetical protein